MGVAGVASTARDPGELKRAVSRSRRCSACLEQANRPNAATGPRHRGGPGLPATPPSTWRARAAARRARFCLYRPACVAVDRRGRFGPVRDRRLVNEGRGRLGHGFKRLRAKRREELSGPPIGHVRSGEQFPCRRAEVRIDVDHAGHRSDSERIQDERARCGIRSVNESHVQMTPCAFDAEPRQPTRSGVRVGRGFVSRKHADVATGGERLQFRPPLDGLDTHR